MREVNPEFKMIYIGEMGGACANEEFIEVSKIISNDIIARANSKFKSWPGLHDRIYMIE